MYSEGAISNLNFPPEVFTEEVVGGKETLQPLPVYHDGRWETGGDWRNGASIVCSVYRGLPAPLLWGQS